MTVGGEAHPDQDAPRRVLFDANVLLDVLLRRKGLVEESARLWNAADGGRLRGVVVATAVTTVEYLVGRAYDATRARADVEAVLATFEVAAVGRAELTGALASRFTDFEDGVVHEAARAARCDGIVTRNGRDFGAAVLPVYAPAELLAALAEREGLVQGLFSNKCLNEEGVYGVYLYIAGQRREFVLDDYFPCREDRNQTLFLQARPSALWPLFLEKAWAKSYSNYWNSMGKVMVEEILEDLLGCPCQGYLTSNFNSAELAELIREFTSQNFIGLCLSSLTLSKEDLLKPGHAYTLLGIDSKNIVSIRNPYLMNPEQQLGLGSERSLENDIIEMSLPDFHQKFQYLSFAFLSRNWFMQTLSWESQPNHAKYILFEIRQSE